MRQIKLRAWDTINNQWFDGGAGFALSWDATEIFDDNGQEYDTETIVFEQFTGLLDKNGKEIYEGDVLRGREEGDGETTAWQTVEYIVFFKDGSFRIREKHIEETSAWCDYLSDKNILEYYEVVGNIHEPPTQ